MTALARILAAATFLACVTLPLAEAQNAPAVATAAKPPVSETKHEGDFNGVHVAYTATVGETLVKNDKGADVASVVTTSYVADGATQRPVVFMFNGGPTTASYWLHMGIFGPKRIVFPDDLSAPIAAPYKVIDNHDTILDVADIVLIDPPGTGFSRVLPAGDKADVYSTAGDARVFAQFISQWLEGHQRSVSKVYIVGESYGTIRAPVLLDQLSKLPKPVTVSGVFLMGQAINIVETTQRPENIIGQAVNLPTLAAVAWFHNKASHKGKTFEGFLAEVRTFAMNDYLMALSRGQMLDKSTERKIASKLASYTGLPTDYWLTHRLGITKIQYRSELFKAEGLNLGNNDARYVGKANDPASVVNPAFEGAFAEHLKGFLGVSTDMKYQPSLADNPGSWSYGGETSPFNMFNFQKPLSDAMKRNPSMLLMLGSGYYDMTTTFGAAEYLVARSDLPLDRVELRYYQGGHMPYTNASQLPLVTVDVRRLIAGKLKPMGAKP